MLYFACLQTVTNRAKPEKKKYLTPSRAPDMKGVLKIYQIIISHQSDMLWLLIEVLMRVNNIHFYGWLVVLGLTAL